MKFYLLLVGFSLFYSYVNTEGLDDVINYGVNKIDSLFSCSKYDGVAACYHNNWKKRDLKCAGACMDNRWSYSPWFSGRCYCCYCP